MIGRVPRRAAAPLIALAGVVDVGLAAVPDHALRLGWDAVPTYGWHRYALTAAGVCCVAIAPAVARGRREARWVGCGTTTLSMLIAVLHDADVLAFAPSALAFVALLAVGPLPGRADPRLARRAVGTLLAGEVATFAYAVAGLYLYDTNFRESTSIAAAITEAVRLLFLLPSAAIQPATDHGAWFLDSVRWLSALVIGLACVRALAPSLGHARADHDAARARNLLERWGTSSLAPFHLLEDKHWEFSGDGQTFVGYALSGATAVALGGPVGAPGAREDAVRRFLDTCERHGWTPAFHQVDAQEVELLRRHGLQAIKIGEEAVVDVQPFSLAGGAMKPIRKAVTRAEREGLTVSELRRPVDAAGMSELRAISDAWLASSGHRERGFTLGAFDEEVLRGALVVVVRDADGRAVAFANIVDSYRGTAGNFDLMRRAPDAPRGAMELLFVALIERFRERQLAGMSLGLAPLAGIEGSGVLARLLTTVRQRGTFMNFVGLEDFKGKWRPRWEARYFAYPSGTDLARTATATALAGEQPGRGPTADVLARVGRRFPASLMLGGAMVWFMAATAGDAGYHATLVGHFALNWGDLAALQWWRVSLSSLVQEDPGFAAPILGLLVVLPLAERRFGMLPTVALFLVCDAVSSVPTLALLQVAGDSGSATAAELASEPNLGSSAGLLGLLAAWITALPRSRWQVASAALLALGLLAGIAVERELADVQHLLGAGAGAMLGLTLRRRG